MAVESVSLKLPTSPMAWFAQAEAQFVLRNISQDGTKYYHVVASLDTNAADRALSVITSPPSTDKYKAIQTFLVSAYGLTDGERATALAPYSTRVEQHVWPDVIRVNCRSLWTLPSSTVQRSWTVLVPCLQ